MTARCLGILSACVIAFWGINARANDQVDRFVKKCNAYVRTEEGWNLPKKLRVEVSKLAKHNVPIRLSLTRCDFIRHQITLDNGSTVSVKSAYPNQEDPDTKGNHYSWDPQSPSQKYWLFRFYGWEWAGWLLVNKTTGNLIETRTECAKAPIQFGQNLIATVCMGNYENEQPTLYVADLSKPTIRWTDGLAVQPCQERDMFRHGKLAFVGRSKLTVSGECVVQDFYSRKITRRVKVKQVVHITPEGLVARSRDDTFTAGWK